MAKKVKWIPPDGGYGWVIVFAGALSNFVLIPLIQSFGLIFKDKFKELGFTATQGSLIINVNSAFGMLTGLFNGTLLKYYGYRKISYLGGFMLTFGVFLTSFSNSFIGFMISYGLIASLGLGLSISSYSLAVNTFFKEKKSKAISLMMSFTGFGPIILPQIINILIREYDTSGVTLILSAICAHSFIAATLLQPIKRHMRKIYVDEEVIREECEDDLEAETYYVETLISPQKDNESQNVRNRKSSVTSNNSINYEQENAGVLGLDSTLGGSMLSLSRPDLSDSRPSLYQTKTQWWKSKSTVNLESSVNIFEGKFTKIKDDGIPEEKQQQSKIKKFFRRIIKILDLDLLRDPIYVNIMIGMSLAVFAEMNFSVLTAFILSDLGLTTDQIATFMSVLGIADIIFRFLAPYIGEFLKKPPRIMYMFTILALIFTRMGLIIFNTYYPLLMVSILLGFAKGIRTVYMSLVIPTYVPLERLPSASGIQMMVNGICILLGGPIIGLIRDVTGSYFACILIMNGVSFTTVFLWSIEMCYLKFNLKKERDRDVIINVTT